MIFYIRYYLFQLYTKISKKKKRGYFLFFFGAYPENLKTGLLTILNSDSEFKYVLSPGNIILRFNTTLKLDEIHLLLKKVYPEYSGCYLLFKDDNNHYRRYTDTVFYDYLFNTSVTQTTVKNSLEKLQKFVDLILNLRNKFLDLSNNNQLNFIDDQPKREKITAEDIDIILDKIQDHGIDSLTEMEKKILNTYTKND